MKILKSGCYNICRYLGFKIVALIVLIFCFFLVYMFVGSSSSNPPPSSENHDSIDVSNIKNLFPDRLKKLVDELSRIKLSVKNELVELERKRSTVLKDINVFTNQVNSLKTELSRYSRDTDRLRMSFVSLKLHKDDLDRRNVPVLRLPLVAEPSLEAHDRPQSVPTEGRYCTLQTCFHWERCSISKSLDFYLHVDDNLPDSSFVRAFKSANRVSKNESIACVDLTFSAVKYKQCLSKTRRNCLFIRNSHPGELTHSSLGMIADFNFKAGHYRQGFDLILPAPVTSDQLNKKTLPNLLPARRPVLLAFSGSRGPQSLWSKQEKAVVVELLKFNKSSVHFNFSCLPNVATDDSTVLNDWQLCKSPSGNLTKTTYCLILGPFGLPRSSLIIQQRLLQCLLAGSIPVVLGDLLLPFEEVLHNQWASALIRLPPVRVTELEVMLHSFPDSDVVEMRRQGRVILERCLINAYQQSLCLALQLSRRLRLLPPPIQSISTSSLVNTSDPGRVYPVTSNAAVELDDYLGPVDLPVDSLQFQRNFSSAFYLSSGRALEGASGDPDPFHLYPSTPWAPKLPTEAQFLGSSFGFRPVDYSVNRAGAEFSESLGGNLPYEQYTIVILTYDRINVLMSTLETLLNVPYLNSIVVVWNNPEPPARSLKWPKLHVPIHVVRGPKENTLNNRFVPYDVIKTEAILSLDDDVQMRHDEIVFGFRVWREHRDQIVGFPARYHSWQKQEARWDYGKGYSCQYSVILTGSAFFHKYYTFLYTYTMSPAIRELVDKETNCEDIAMNFLISHVTRKPPVKVTSRWTFACPGCANSLHNRSSHYDKRGVCMNRLTSIYGYNPLLYTQYRADSVLFKTRLPPDKQKCFKYI